MEFRQLEYFITLAKELHFTRAAEKLHISQPTLSHQIKALEDEVGTQLFDRIGKKITLTEAGKILYDQSLNIFSIIENTKMQLNELEMIQRGSLKIGALPGELSNFVSDILVSYVQQYPQVKISVHSSDDLITLLNDNQVDYAFSYRYDSMHNCDEQIVQIPLYKDKFVFVAGKNHPLMEKEELNLSELIDEPLILFSELQMCRKIINTVAKLEQVPINPVFETSDIHTIFDFVKKDLGGTIVAESFYKFHQHKDITARPILNDGLSRETVFIYRKDKFFSAVAKSFIPTLINYLNNHPIELPSTSEEVLMKLI